MIGDAHRNYNCFNTFFSLIKYIYNIIIIIITTTIIVIDK